MNINKILFEKARSYGFRSWFSKNNSSLPNYSLKKELMFRAFDNAIIEAQNIDCIWFDGDMRMPALFKVCTENIIEGLFRLNNVKEFLPKWITKFFLIVEDEYYQVALDELIKPTFKNSGIIIVKISDLSHTLIE
jgi:hypothetical protein